jgi:integrase
MEEQRILKELDPSSVKDSRHKKSRQAARDIFILMVDGGFRINEASIMQWSDVDFDNGVIYLYRSKVSNDDFIPMTNRLRTTLLNRQKAVEGAVHTRQSVLTLSAANFGRSQFRGRCWKG